MGTGDYCGKCKTSLMYCYCNKNEVPGIIGWVCPKCKEGLSPFVDRCPCIPISQGQWTVKGSS